MEDTDNQIEGMIQFHLKHGFYFLFMDWSNEPVPEYVWQDGNGDLKAMSSMGLDHLKASSRFVEKSLEQLLTPPRPQKEVVEALEPYARMKLQELNETFRNKVGS